MVLSSVPGCVLSPHRTSPGMGWALSAAHLTAIQEDPSSLENRDWQHCLDLANSSFKIHSFHLFGYEIAARQQSRNHQWKFFLQEGRWFNWPWNWELLLKSILLSVMGIQVEEAGKQGPNSGNSQHYFMLISQKTRGFIVSGTNFLSKGNSNRNHCQPGTEHSL